MATHFLRADWPALFRLAVLVDDYWTTGDPQLRRALAGEVRLQERTFGLGGGGVTVSCEWCEEPFAATRATARFCKPAHRAAAWREAQK
jgi:hypothetical protein